MKEKEIKTLEDRQREKELWEHEGEIAIRIVRWFDLLIKLRRRADEGVPPEDLIEQLLRADPDMLDHDCNWLMSMLVDRFNLTQEQLNRRRPSKIHKAVYVDAWLQSPDGSVSDIARRLGVSRAALHKWLKKNPAFNHRKSK